MSRAGLGPLVQGMAGAQSWESHMRFSESGLKKKCCLSPPIGGPGFGLREGPHSRPQKGSDRTSIGAGKDSVAQERT